MMNIYEIFFPIAIFFIAIIIEVLYHVSNQE
jgi:uncharacterized membrane protein